MIKKNRMEYLTLKCLIMENKIDNLEKRIKDLYEEINEIINKNIIKCPLNSPTNSDLKDFHSCMNRIYSYDILEK